MKHFAKNLNWYRIEYVAKGRLKIHVRTWHPGFWVEVYRTLRESGSGRLESLWLIGVCIWKV